MVLTSRLSWFCKLSSQRKSASGRHVRKSSFRLRETPNSGGATRVLGPSLATRWRSKWHPQWRCAPPGSEAVLSESLGGLRGTTFCAPDELVEYCASPTPNAHFGRSGAPPDGSGAALGDAHGPKTDEKSMFSTHLVFDALRGAKLRQVPFFGNSRSVDAKRLLVEPRRGSRPDADRPLGSPWLLSARPGAPRPIKNGAPAWPVRFVGAEWPTARPAPPGVETGKQELLIKHRGSCMGPRSLSWISAQNASLPAPPRLPQRSPERPYGPRWVSGYAEGSY